MKPEDEKHALELTWHLRVSRRARSAKLQIRPFGGLEVVVPPRFPRSEVAGLVEKHATWARHQVARQTKLRESIHLPQNLSLAFDGSSTPVVYRSDSLQFNLDLFEEPGADRIIIHASDQQSRIVELRTWLRRRAHARFPGLLHQLSIRTGLGFSKVSIRSQKTRWGSCSARGNINLNDQLLFLPAATVEYLMIHELCHTRHLNHSKAYWALVETHCPDYRQQDALLSSSRERVPDWLLLDLYN